MEGGGVCGREFGVAPATFGADGQDGFGCVGTGEHGAKRLCFGRFGEQDAQGVRVRCGERCFRFREWIEDRDLHAARLLRAFEEDFLPAGGSFGSGGEQSFFAAGGGERDDAGDAEFGGFFEGPFESVKFYDREKQDCFAAWGIAGELFDEFEIDFVASDSVDAAEPERSAVREFVELARLRAEHAAEMVRGFALHGGALVLEVVDEEAAAHWIYCCTEEVAPARLRLPWHSLGGSGQAEGGRHRSQCTGKMPGRRNPTG